MGGTRAGVYKTIYKLLKAIISVGVYKTIYKLLKTIISVLYLISLEIRAQCYRKVFISVIYECL
jgi:hypothetical protein